MVKDSLLRFLSAGSDLKKEEEGNAWRKAEISILRSNLQTMWNNLYNPGMNAQPYRFFLLSSIMSSILFLHIPTEPVDSQQAVMRTNWRTEIIICKSFFMQ